MPQQQKRRSVEYQKAACNGRTPARGRAARFWRRLRFFVVCELFFGVVFCFLLCYYGPFDNIRNTLVTTAMSTFTHQYLATWFLPQETIDRILAENGTVLRNDKQQISTGGFSVSDNSIEIIEIAEQHFSGKLMVVHDPSRVDIALSPTFGEKGSTLSTIVRQEQAVGGVNAGGFLNVNGSDVGAFPQGIVVRDGEVIYAEEGLTSFPLAGFTENNVLVVSSGMTLEEIEAANLRCAVSFSPPLIVNGTVQVVRGGAGRQPRTAIGQRADGAVLLLTIDGRSASSLGATMSELAEVLYEYGAVTALNLDGGSSTTMVYQGKVINNPSDILGERSIPSAFIVRPAG